MKGRVDLTFTEMGKTAGRTGLLDGNQALSFEHGRFEMPAGHPSGDIE